MANWLKVDTKKKLLIMDRAFAKNSAIVGSEEYIKLQNARADYPLFNVVRHTIKKTKKECYYGLTYDYMRKYIASHGSKETSKNILEELEEKLLISECHSKGFRYPVIKEWFLETYPEVKEFGTGITKDKIPA